MHAATVINTLRLVKAVAAEQCGQVRVELADAGARIEHAEAVLEETRLTADSTKAARDTLAKLYVAREVSEWKRASTSSNDVLQDIEAARGLQSLRALFH
ncbi:unnamed protein product, partial [Chrysoparadoxa australica]